MSSILVRKHCQPVLDDAGYSMFFCTISEERYYDPLLMIYTTCGKPFAEVHGVSFSKRKPTIQECEYSAVLLEQWLSRHKDDFEEYVDAYTDFHSLQAPEGTKKVKGATITIDATSIIIRRPFTYIGQKSGKEHEYDFAHYFSGDGKTLLKIDFPAIARLTPAEVAAKVKLPKTLLDAALKFRNEHKKYWDVRDRMQKAQEAVRSCKI